MLGPFWKFGNLVVDADMSAIRMTPPCDLKLEKVMLAVRTAPTGSSIIVDVTIDGNSVFSSPEARAKIMVGENYGESADLAVETLRHGEYPVIDLDQIGSGVAGAGLTVMIVGTTEPEDEE